MKSKICTVRGFADIYSIYSVNPLLA